MPASAPTAAVVVIGNEILSGRTQDVNLSFLARELSSLGIRVIEARVVADDEAAIVEAVNTLRRRCTYVFTTGGIGPTHDDITSKAVAKAFGLPHGRHPEAEQRLLAYYDPDMVNEARMRMADTPQGAVLIDNPVSAAPGFRVENVHVLPGVPKIMQAMFDGLRATLEGGAPMLARSIVLFCPEGEAARPLGELQLRHAGVEIGSYPFFRRDRHGTTIVIRGTDQALVDAAAADLVATAAALGVETTEVPMTGSPLSEW